MKNSLISKFMELFDFISYELSFYEKKILFKNETKKKETKIKLLKINKH